MSKEKEFKKICESWENWINEQAPLRTGDQIDPDNPEAYGYVKTKKGFERVASIPRPDDELAIPGMNPEAEKELNKRQAKKQKERGMGYEDAEEYEKETMAAAEVVKRINDAADSWNGNPVTSFLFKIPGAKGAPKNYSWGNFAVDLGILVASMVPPLAGVVATAGKAVKAGIAARVVANPKSRAVLFAAALQAPKTISKAMALAGGKLGTFGAEKVVLSSTQKVMTDVVDGFEKGGRISVPFLPKHMTVMMNLAKKRGKLKELMKDKEFTQAAREAGVIGKKG